ncbi:terminase [Ignatzschineria sp. LJL83]
MTDVIKTGRPTKYRDSFVEDAYKLSLLGLIDKQLAFFFGVSESTLNRWKLAYPEFSEALKRGKALADAEVVEALYRSAIGFSYEESVVKEFNGRIEVIKTIKHRPPSSAAMIFWLRNRQPDKWSNNPSPKVEEHNAQPVQIVVGVQDARINEVEH